MKLLHACKLVVPGLVFGLVTAATYTFAASAPAPRLPESITTTDGKTYQGVQFVSSDPEGLTVEYRLQPGGVGMARLKFRNLPEELRQQFNYNESAASDYAASRQQAAANLREQTRAPQNEKDATPHREPTPRQEELRPANADQDFIGRFRVAGTIRGAMIVDSVTGEAWFLDQHSVLQDWQQDYSSFLSPKIQSPSKTENGPRVVLIGP